MNRFLKYMVQKLSYCAIIQEENTVLFLNNKTLIALGKPKKAMGILAILRHS